MEDSNYLFRLATTYSTTNEQLSRFYMLKFIQKIKSQGIGLNEQLLPQFCGHCYTVFVPSCNCTIELVPKQKSKQVNVEKKILNYVPQLISEPQFKNADKLIYTCSKCQTKHIFPIAKPSKTNAKKSTTPSTKSKKKETKKQDIQKVQKQNKIQKQNSVKDFLSKLKV